MSSKIHLQHRSDVDNLAVKTDLVRQSSSFFLFPSFVNFVQGNKWKVSSNNYTFADIKKIFFHFVTIHEMKCYV